MRQKEDLTGKMFGNWLVLYRADDYISSSGKHYSMWMCECQCEKKIIKVVAESSLKQEKSKSCGCQRSKLVSESKRQHGMTHTRIYNIWCGIKTRCYLETDNSYPNWGGRGIVMCDEWKDNFPAFLEWAMENGYSDDLTIDRIDNNGNYEPSNCRWITQAAQNRNRRDNVCLTYDGKTMTCAEWSRELGLHVGTVNNRLHKGYSIEECLFGRKETANKVRTKQKKQSQSRRLLQSED